LTEPDGKKAPDAVVDVAVAVIEAPGKRYLLAQRPSGKPMAGYWEFPGGKLEPGETPRAALAREIDEELGLKVLVANPWVTMAFVYPHAHVRLHFMRVPRWQGHPVGREQQTFRFECIEQLLVEPWLPAALPLKRWLKIGSLYAISDAHRVGLAAFVERFERAARQRGAFWMVLREPDLSPADFDHLYHLLVPRARAAGVKLLVSSRHPERYWQGADGVHLTCQDLHRIDKRPVFNWVFASCHDANDLVRAAQLGLDAAMLGQVKKTASHAQAVPLGWAGFARAIHETPLPVFALGGLDFDESTLFKAQSLGAQGVAAMRAAWPR